MSLSRLLLWAALSAAAVGTTGCAASYSGAAIQGQIVDSQTQQPLAGVVVVAEWLLEGRVFHPDTVGRLMLIETVTDAAGRYRIPAWGPEVTRKGHLERGSPRLNFYKPGYAFKSVSNEGQYAPYVELPDPLTSEWDGKTIALKRHQPEEFESIDELGSASRLLYRDLELCAWEKMPLMTAALLRRAAEYESKGLGHGLPPTNRFQVKGKCADPKTILGEQR